MNETKYILYPKYINYLLSLLATDNKISVLKLNEILSKEILSIDDEIDNLKEKRKIRKIILNKIKLFVKSEKTPLGSEYLKSKGIQK